jgi:hypothetical protein
MVQLETARRSVRLEAHELTHGLPNTIEPGMEAHADRITAIRRAIANGTYETPDKVCLVVCRLLEDLYLDSRVSTDAT